MSPEQKEPNPSDDQSEESLERAPEETAGTTNSELEFLDEVLGDLDIDMISILAQC